ncbi:hypothetical protein J2X65_005419 [Ancylobacter sp. 3268]|nr:hypothetical protein [Ancylobacter sp. 3268]
MDDIGKRAELNDIGARILAVQQRISDLSYEARSVGWDTAAFLCDMLHLELDEVLRREGLVDSQAGDVGVETSKIVRIHPAD